MRDNRIEQEIRRKLRTSTIMLINLSEESEKRGISLDSIRAVQRNLEELTSLLEQAKDYSRSHPQAKRLSLDRPAQ